MEINRWDWRYWLDGGGAWVNRWEATSHDYWLLTGVVVATLIMVTTYSIFAIQNERGAKYVNDFIFSRYLVALRNSVLVSGTIHLLQLVAWVNTYYWVMVLLMLVHAYQAWVLIWHKNQVLKIQKSVSMRLSVTRLNEAVAHLEQTVGVKLEEREEAVLQLDETAKTVEKLETKVQAAIKAAEKLDKLDNDE